jgi:membrane protease YdiL (CAAX protease family)
VTGSVSDRHLLVPTDGDAALAPIQSAAQWTRFLAGFAVLLTALLGISEIDATGRYGLGILAVVLLVGLLVERVAFGVRPREALRLLGFGQPGWRALLLACVIGALVQLVYPVAAAMTGTTFTLRPDWLWLLIGLFAFHGLAEELVWRGYAYRRLRQGRSFGRTVLWTMPLVAVSHVPIVINSGPVVGAAALLVAAITSIPLAYLFDTGRSSIWAPAVVHTAIDTFKLVVIPTAALTTFPLMLSAVSIVVPLLVLFVPRRFLESSPMNGTTTHGWWQALRWPVVGLVVVGVLIALAFALDTGSATNRDVALIIGAPTLFVLLPLAVVWLIVAAVRQRGRTVKSRTDQEPGRTTPDS